MSHNTYFLSFLLLSRGFRLESLPEAESSTSGEEEKGWSEE
jgi:hypothetical protein